jgi:hypothetical protein
MHALPSHPKHPLVAAFVALVAALIVMAAAAPDLGTVDLSLGGGSSTAQPAAPAASDVATSSKPAWVTDPLLPPTYNLTAGR